MANLQYLSNGKLSLAARFDDMCRFQNSIFSHDRDSFIEFKKILKFCEQIQSKNISISKELKEANKKIFHLESVNTELGKKFTILKLAYEEKSQILEKTSKELIELKSKIKKLNYSTIEYNYQTLSDEDLLSRLIHLRTVDDHNDETNSNEHQSSNSITVSSEIPITSTVSTKNSRNISNISSESAENKTSFIESAKNIIESETEKDDNTIGDEESNTITPQKKNHSILESIKSNYQTPLSSLPTNGDINNNKYKHQWHNKLAFMRKINCSECKRRIKLFSDYATCNKCGYKVHNNCTIESFCHCDDLNHSRTLMDFIKLEQKPWIPNLLVKCCNEIEKRGLNVKHLYKIQKANSYVKPLMLDLLYPTSQEQKIPILDIHSLCNVVIHFLQYLVDLDDSLIPSFLWNDLETLIFSNDIKKEKLIKEIIFRLPIANRDTLAFIIIHLKKVSENENLNNVSISTLAKIFGPKIIQMDHSLDSNILKKHKIIQEEIMMTLLTSSSDFWNQLLHSFESSPNKEIFQSPYSVKSTKSSVYGTPNGDCRTENLNDNVQLI